MILLLFFCSGAAALVYEVIWSKYLALLFGSTVQAQTVVLAVFMGGRALGNRWFSGRADRARRPLAVYGGLELAVGLYALVFPLLYQAAEMVFTLFGSPLLNHSGWLLLLKGVLSVGLLAGPTILMGGTLPVLAAWLQQNTPEGGRWSARFYSTNSLGAVVGAAMAGFWLIPGHGLPFTLKMAAFINLFIGLAAIGLAGKGPAAAGKPAAVKTKTEEPAVPKILRWGCVVVALSGGVSMGLEVLASRCLGLIFGSSLQAFAIVLMAFILGIGLGSAVIASPRWGRWPKGLTAVLLLVAAALIGLVVLNIANLVEVYRYARSGLSATPIGYRYYETILSLMSLGILGLPAAALGAVLPLWIRMVSEAAGGLGERVGRLLAWNTLGAVAGVLLTGFALMPALGLRGSFAGLALVAAAAAVLTALATRQRAAGAAGVAVGVFLIAVSAGGGEGWRYALSAGMFRVHETDPALVPMSERRKMAQLLFYEDAADATVSVERDRLSPAFSELVLRINGKADASSHSDLSTQILLGQLPLLARPDSRDVFCFGLGSGITAGTALGYPIEHLTVAENCAPVLQAAKLFAQWNQGALTDKRVHIYGEDARTVLKLSPQKYDAIIAEPSNPWVVNVGSVFSAEFYRLAASRLKPGGLMTQWFHTYEMDDDTLDVVLRTFAAVFPNMEIWDASPGDIILLGSDRPWRSDPSVYQRAFALEGPRRDLASIGLTSPESVLARQLASQRTAFAIPGPGPLQRDDFPLLEYAAPRAMYIDSGKQAQRFLRFDERTYQSNVAPGEKNRVLAQLDDAALSSIFCDFFPSVNPELQQFVQARVDGRLAANFSLRSLPCIFRGSNETAVFRPAMAQTDMILYRLYQAEAALRNDPAERSQAVADIKNALDEIQSYNREEAGWSAGRYAFLAAEVSLRLGDAAQARAVLLRGLQLEPDSEELNYLARIMLHEGKLAPAEAVSINSR